jgi:hypothetical protein
MNELADRIEALTGPDREADAAIAVAMRNGLPLGSEWALKFPKWEVEPGSKGVVRIIGNVNGNCDDISGRFTAPRYTSSIDAAMTLVPKGWSWSVGFDEHGNRAIIGAFGNMETIASKAANPALAICAAALRARA